MIGARQTDGRTDTVQSAIGDNREGSDHFLQDHDKNQSRTQQDGNVTINVN